MEIKIKQHVEIIDKENGFSIIIIPSGFKDYFNTIKEHCTNLDLGESPYNVFMESKELEEYLNRGCGVTEIAYIKEILNSLK